MTYKPPSSSIKNRFDQNWLRTVHFCFRESEALTGTPPKKKKSLSVDLVVFKNRQGFLDNAN